MLSLAPYTKYAEKHDFPASAMRSMIYADYSITTLISSLAVSVLISCYNILNGEPALPTLIGMNIAPLIWCFLKVNLAEKIINQVKLYQQPLQERMP